MRFPDLNRVDPPSTPADRVRAMLERTEIEEAGLRRRLSAQGCTEAEIELRVTAWYHHRPGAEHGDAEGIPGVWPRS